MFVALFSFIIFTSSLAESTAVCQQITRVLSQKNLPSLQQFSREYHPIIDGLSIDILKKIQSHRFDITPLDRALSPEHADFLKHQHLLLTGLKQMIASKILFQERKE